MGIYEIKLLLPNNIWDVSFQKSSQSTMRLCIFKTSLETRRGNGFWWSTEFLSLNQSLSLIGASFKSCSAPYISSTGTIKLNLISFGENRVYIEDFLDFVGHVSYLKYAWLCLCCQHRKNFLCWQHWSTNLYK